MITPFFFTTVKLSGILKRFCFVAKNQLYPTAVVGENNFCRPRFGGSAWSSKHVLKKIKRRRNFAGTKL